MEILYEDKNIVVCKKEVGQISEMSDTKPSLAKLVYEKYGYAGVIHRLDANVGGAIVYAKNKTAASYFSSLVADGKLDKEYLAVVKGTPEAEGVFKDFLFKDSSKNKVFVVKRMRKGVKEASLEYSLLQTTHIDDMPVSLVKIKLHTGRSHQIRVQFSNRKFPLLGDGKYGSYDNKCTVALWSYCLECDNKLAKGKLCVKSLPPISSYPWNLFDIDNLM